MPEEIEQNGVRFFSITDDLKDCRKSTLLESDLSGIEKDAEFVTAPIGKEKENLPTSEGVALPNVGNPSNDTPTKLTRETGFFSINPPFEATYPGSTTTLPTSSKLNENVPPHSK